METNIEQKILRFAELSKEFSEKPEELSNYQEYQNSSFVTGSVTLGYVSSACCSGSTSAPSPLERFKADKEEEIKKAERWFEYVELRKNIEDYFKAKLKLSL
jgi:hypothetical protein